MIRVVIDPGVFIAALIGSRGGAPDLVVRALMGDRISVVASPRLLADPRTCGARSSSRTSMSGPFESSSTASGDTR